MWSWQRGISHIASTSCGRKNYCSTGTFHLLWVGDMRSATRRFSTNIWIYGIGLKLYNVGIQGSCQALISSPVPTLYPRPCLRRRIPARRLCHAKEIPALTGARKANVDKAQLRKKKRDNRSTWQISRWGRNTEESLPLISIWNCINYTHRIIRSMKKNRKKHLSPS